MPTTWGRGGQHLAGDPLAVDPNEGHASRRHRASEWGAPGISKASFV
jgi:hypothetical protein